MTQYERGANFERRVKRWLEGQGYFVIRSAGSKGPVDLVAVSAYETVLVQCKRGGRISQPEVDALASLKRRLNVKVAVVSLDGRKIKAEYLWGGPT